MRSPYPRFCPPKLDKSRGIEEIPLKTPKLSSLTHGFGRGIKGKRTTKGSHEFPTSNPQEQGPENTTRKTPRKGSENHH
jgi:hypothetical protein